MAGAETPERTAVAMALPEMLDVEPDRSRGAFSAASEASAGAAEGLIAPMTDGFATRVLPDGTAS